MKGIDRIEAWKEGVIFLELAKANMRNMRGEPDEYGEAIGVEYVSVLSRVGNSMVFFFPLLFS